MVAIRRICAPDATLREDFTYDAAGRRVSDARYDDLSASTLIARTTTTYDALGRILGLETRDTSNTLVADFDYTYDAAGRLTSKNDDGALTTYSYDNTNQLTGEDAASDDRTYSYDANGNRTMSGYSHGSDNRLTTDGTWNYTYDDEGSMIEKERISDGLTWFYAYDHRNQLTKLEQSDNGTAIDLRIEYKYDAWGNRIARSIDRDADGALNPEVMQFALDGWNPAKPAPIGTENVDVWADLEIDGTLATRYLRSDRVDELLARIDDLSGDPTKYWTVADHLGSTRILLDANADVANALTYDGYGNILTETDASVRGRYAWTSREIDVEAGLQYNRARAYDATIGRWISKDPMGFGAGDSNLFRYAHNRVTQFGDPSGLLLVAMDGTEMKEYLADPRTPLTATHLWRSHVKNFFNSYRGKNKFYDPGTPNRLPDNASPDVVARIESAYNYIVDNWDGCEGIDLVGHSRGGYSVLRLAWLLEEIGLPRKIGEFAEKKVRTPVRFLGLYDAVPMVNNSASSALVNPLIKDAYLSVPGNVQNTFAVFAAPSSKDGKFAGSRQVWPTNWPRAGFAGGINYASLTLKGTHSALGGAPWDGDRPTGHSELQDIVAAQEADTRMREAAIDANVPIDMVSRYGYKVGGGRNK